MAWYEITRKCGCVEDMQIYGKVDKRDEIAEYEASKYCKKCYIEKEDEKIGELIKDMIKLEGSEKQINWANKIRVEFLSDKNDMVDRAKQYYRVECKDLSKKLDILNRAYDNIMKNNSAKWWIDNRAMCVRHLKKEIIKLSSEMEKE